jgi:hypothetical protein
MSAEAWLRSQRDRPISDGERRAVFTIIAVAAATLLAFAVPGAPSPPAATHLHADARPEAPTSAVVAVSSAAEERTAREFLHGYIAYIYGRASAREIRGATSAFTHALLASPRRVPPSMRAQRPRILALQVVNAPTGALRVTASVNDGALIDYPVALLLVRHGSRLLVSGFVGA